MKKVGTFTAGLITTLAIACLAGCGQGNDASPSHDGQSHSHDSQDATADTKGAVPAKAYPLKNCVVSGEALGSMGKPVSLTYKGQEVKFCCKGCIDDFNAEPDTYLTKILAGAANQ